jgi:hypothetical protein
MSSKSRRKCRHFDRLPDRIPVPSIAGRGHPSARLSSLRSGRALALASEPMNTLHWLAVMELNSKQEQKMNINNVARWVKAFGCLLDRRSKNFAEMTTIRFQLLIARNERVELHALKWF